jgi:nitrite reductase (NADH) small subunit
MSDQQDWTEVCSVEDIPMLGSRRVARERGAAIAIFRAANDTVHALLDRCPHKGGPLSQGIVFGDRVACPLHNWSIGLADGQAAAPDVGCTPRFAVRMIDGAVHLSASEMASLGIDLPLPVAGPCLRGAVEPVLITHV